MEKLIDVGGATADRSGDRTGKNRKAVRYGLQQHKRNAARIESVTRSVRPDMTRLTVCQTHQTLPLHVLIIYDTVVCGMPVNFEISLSVMPSAYIWQMTAFLSSFESKSFRRYRLLLIRL